MCAVPRAIAKVAFCRSRIIKMHLARATRPSTVVVLVCMALLACSPAQEVQIRPVKVVRVHQQLAGQTAYGTGEIQARYDTALGFLVGGRIIERSAEVGKIVKAGDVLARLDEEVQRANVTGAAGRLTGAEAAPTQAASAARRAQSLLRIGAGTAEAEELSVSAPPTAAANVQATLTNLSNARQQLYYTLLSACTIDAGADVPAQYGH